MAQVEWGAPPAYGGGFTQRVSQQGPQRQAARAAQPYDDTYADPYPDAYATGQADSYESEAYHDAQTDPAAAPYPPQAASGNLFNVVGAVLSIGLMLGMGYWGYRLAVRDVTGVPVVRAMAGPMRVQPDDPGGEEAAYQGYAVNEVQANGTAAAPADRLALAPRPTGLAPEDQAPAAGGTGNAVALSALPQADAGDDPEAAILALADRLAAGVEPLTEISPTSTGNATSEGDRATPAQPAVQPSVQPAARTTEEIVDQVVNEVASAAEILPASVPGVARSPWPASRPEGLVTLAAARIATPPEAAETGSVREVAASAIPLGTQLVQLGAFASPEIARSEWDRLAARFADYFEGKTRVVAQATTGGRKFWRLRAMGFENLADARRFCAVLANGRAACIPVVTR